MSHVPHDDVSLVAAVVAGSEDALAALYDRHVDAIHAAAFRLTGDRQLAEDIVQEVFLALWNRAERFDPAAGSLSAWLGAIARNRAIDRLRAAGRRPRFVSLATGPDGDDAAMVALERAAQDRGTVGGVAPGMFAVDPEVAAEAVEMRVAINAALEQMPDPEREVILLAYRDELSQSEIAARLGWPLGTVKTRTRRALGRLREVLASFYGAEIGEVPLPVDQGTEVPQ